MTYTQDVGQVSAMFHPLKDVEHHTTGRGTVMRFTATGADTRGQFGLFEWHMQPNSGGPDAHFHKTFSESFYMTAGTVRLYDGETWVDATAGDFLYIPEGGIHAFQNASDDPASMLILFAPAPAREKYFRELVEISTTGRTLTEDEWTELFARHDQYRAT
jgi:quercetin dioxygenase-like cupin family protein